MNRARAATLPGAASAAVVRLALTDFRCYGRLRLDVDARPVVLTGPNGAGKTNLLEALSFLSPGRGLRRARLSEADRMAGAQSVPWAVAATLESPRGRAEIGTAHEREGEHGAADGRRVVKVDGHMARGQTSLAEAVSVLWLTPDMDRLFAEGPGPRRRFLDRLVYGFDPDHARRIHAYEHGLRERARLLREGRADPAWLAALEDRMAREGVAVAVGRRLLVDRLARAQGLAAGHFPKAGVALAGAVDSWLDEGPALAAEDRLRAALAESRAQDAATGGAAAGPHRSDLRVRHMAKDCPAELCSTGEQKALLVSIILAHARLSSLERGAAPVLLLDEVAAHLDDERRRALYGEIVALGAQAWMTGTDEMLFAPLGGSAQFFRVADAAVTPV